ncbi:phage antirepressor [Pediococcus acidilactici]|uniref:phage antirepressor n=2 Tax=Pediococcus acidilactici TaxID=1254 RepID=UPI00232AD2B7|nr:phage antirepressor KilAC domain-containing protein [Pediococcus acidilactici]MDB8860138.1 phage antirepressor KilAC domain-containing protein [Pediococcus acidilactici]MDB8861135.1 phage antirepressor KilAC domain-containing protein [Pediococcus acidilactici]MDB8866026.1 phage antirepressor KilAC domain-containing protein [Pediococcus acidilactici]
MNELQKFNFEGNQVRTLLIDQKPYFVGKDIAEVLGYSDSSSAVSKRVDEEDKTTLLLRQDGSNYKSKTTVINESGMYSLILASKLPSSRKFKHWVTSEVLPAIRKNGAYLTNKKAYDITHNKDALADLLLQAGDQLKQKDLVIQEMKPKALFADSVAASHSTILIGELAKVLRGNGVDIGANRLFQWLRQHGYLINRKGTDWNMPTQRAMDLGLFKIKESSISHADGSISVSKTTKVTGKGQQYFVNKFLKENRLER